jgi:nucleotide-binding universal stress UspA family protein
MKRILTIDDPRMSEDLLHAARYWAELSGASVKILSIIDESAVRDTTRAIGAVGKVSSAMADDFIREKKESLVSILTRTGFTPQQGIAVKVGNLIEEIKKELDDFSPDLVITTSRLRTGVINITDEIMGYTKGNCFIITNTFSPQLFKKIILVMDRPDGETYAADASLLLARRFEGLLYIMMVIDINDQVFINAPDMVENRYASAKYKLEKMVETARKEGITVEAFLKEGAVADVISKVSVNINPDLLVLGGYSRTGLNRLLMGSEAGSLIRKVHTPLLVCKQKMTM